LNAVYKHDKLEKLTEMLSKDPETTLKQVEDALKEEKWSLSLYEKIWLLRAQAAHVELLIRNYQGKSGSKNQEKLRHYQDARAQLQTALGSHEKQFAFLFKKPMSEHYY
jgi:hypothetical protein